VTVLMRVYGQADFVEGLDVDEHSFDKFTVRVHSATGEICVKFMLKTSCVCLKGAAWACGQVRLCHLSAFVLG
jgi:hypothetical protein